MNILFLVYLFVAVFVVVLTLAKNFKVFKPKQKSLKFPVKISFSLNYGRATEEDNYRANTYRINYFS